MSSKNINSQQQKFFNGIYQSPLDKLGYFGQQLRLVFLKCILAGTPCIVAFQRLRRPWLDVLMHCLSFLGTEDFYTPVIVVLAWAINSRQAILFTILMGIGFYMATALKNIIRLPRPPSPPVAVLETTYDWSFPSLHAIIGVVLPGYICVYSLQHYSMSSNETILLLAVILTWCFTVNISRMYLGVHSPADLIFGSTLGLCLLYIFTQLDDSIFHWFTHGSYVSLFMVIYYITILAVHPTSDPPTHSFGETVVTNGVAFGMVFAYRQIIKDDPSKFQALLQQTSERPEFYTLFIMTLGRIVVGFPLILLTRLVCKKIVRSAVFEFCRLLSLEAYSYSDYRKVTVQLNKHYIDGFKIPAQQDELKAKTAGINTNGTHSDKAQNGAIHNGISNGTSNGTCHLRNGKTYTQNGNGVVHHDSDALPEGPAVQYQSSGSFYTRQPIDVDTPTKFVTYSMMSCIACHYMHFLFHWIGLDM